MSLINVNVDIYVDDVLAELDDGDLMDELAARGYTCSKHDDWDTPEPLTREELDMLIAHIDIREQPLHWEWQRIRDKLIHIMKDKK